MERGEEPSHAVQSAIARIKVFLRGNLVDGCSNGQISWKQ